ncbi:MAG: hypothetical protein QXS37_06235, partial [Candidatus Aenigmatarchaeota archaeon]
MGSEQKIEKMFLRSGEYENTRKLDSYISLLLREDPYIVGQDFPKQQWKPLAELKHPIRRSICFNEFVFDVDANSWDSCYKLSLNLENVLNQLNIPFLRFSSGNWLHYHVFMDKDVGCPVELIKEYFILKKKIKITREEFENELMKLLRDLKFYLFYYIISLVKNVDGAKFDVSIMKASKHLIRMEGSLNEKTGYYKSLLLELPKEKPQIKKEDVIFPSEIKYWKIPESLIYYVYDRYIQMEIPKFYSKLKKQIESLKQKKNIAWIDNILSKT